MALLPMCTYLRMPNIIYYESSSYVYQIFSCTYKRSWIPKLRSYLHNSVGKKNTQIISKLAERKRDSEHTKSRSKPKVKNTRQCEEEQKVKRKINVIESKKILSITVGQSKVKLLREDVNFTYLKQFF